MKIVFLDVDGVIVTHSSLMVRPRKHDHCNADPRCIAALNYLTDQTGARIVVSSTWRKDRTLPALRTILNHHFGIHAPVIGMTPVLHNIARSQITVAAERGDEIDYWLRGDHSDPVDSYVILDDDADMGAHRHRLIQTDFENGLTMTKARQAIELLTGRRILR